MNKREKLNFKKSYKAYKLAYHSWKLKGYEMIDAPLTQKEYLEVFKMKKEELARLGKKANIAEEIAKETRYVTPQEARAIAKGVRELGDSKLEKELGTYKKVASNLRSFKASSLKTPGAKLTGREGMFYYLAERLGWEQAKEYYGY